MRSPARYRSRCRSRRRCSFGPLQVDPCAGRGAEPARLGEGEIADAGREIGPDRRASGEVAEEILPAHAVGIDVRPGVRRVAPLRAIVDAEIDGWIEML